MDCQTLLGQCRYLSHKRWPPASVDDMRVCQTSFVHQRQHLQPPRAVITQTAWHILQVARRVVQHSPPLRTLCINDPARMGSKTKRNMLKCVLGVGYGLRYGCSAFRQVKKCKLRAVCWTRRFKRGRCSGDLHSGTSLQVGHGNEQYKATDGFSSVMWGAPPMVRACVCAGGGSHARWCVAWLAWLGVLYACTLQNSIACGIACGTPSVPKCECSRRTPPTQHTIHYPAHHAGEYYLAPPLRIAAIMTPVLLPCPQLAASTFPASQSRRAGRGAWSVQPSRPCIPRRCAHVVASAAAQPAAVQVRNRASSSDMPPCCTCF